MRKSFVGFYQPTDSEYKELWKSGLIVFDTNILLGLYRLPEVARDEVFNAFEQVKERIWIPHQVALEFQRRRFTVISNERKLTSDALKSAQSLLSTLESQVEKLEIDKRGLDIDSKPLVADLKAAHDKLSDAINKVHESQVDIRPQDIVREKLDSLLDGKVGKGFDNQKQLDEYINDGDARYLDKIPPGYEDSVKDKNPNEAFFHFDGVKYPRKFGDLILWKQLIEHVKSESIKHVIFVTGDRKEDWWWKEQGKTIGPRSELVREISTKAGVEVFWMYELGNFLEQAKNYTSAKISNNTLTEVDNVSLLDYLYPPANLNILKSDNSVVFDENKSKLVKFYSVKNNSGVQPIELSIIQDYLVLKNEIEFFSNNNADTIDFLNDDILHYYFLVNIEYLSGLSLEQRVEFISGLINKSRYNSEYCMGVLLLYSRSRGFGDSDFPLYGFVSEILSYQLPIDRIEVGQVSGGQFKYIRSFEARSK